ncbi:hypothetical protein FRB90_006737, partial [Tulasnella sp. 427]
MFAEYVEHASAPPNRSQTNYGLPDIQYEGFESNPFEEEPMSPNDSSFPTGIEQTPIFNLGRVGYTLPAPLVHMDSSSSLLTMAFSNNTLRQLNLNQPDAVPLITLTTKKSPSELTIYRIFMDPSGKHTLITTEQGDNFY